MFLIIAAINIKAYLSCVADNGKKLTHLSSGQSFRCPYSIFSEPVRDISVFHSLPAGYDCLIANKCPECQHQQILKEYEHTGLLIIQKSECRAE